MDDTRVLIVRATTACNLDCSYCYVPQRSAARIGLDTLAKLIAQAAALPEPDIVMIWHGGEPLLMGRRFFAAVVELQGRYPKRFVNAVQTNGLGLSDAMAKFFAEHGFVVAVSLDLPRERHDAYRRFKGDRSGFALIAANIGHLRRHGLPVAILSVVTALDDDAAAFARVVEQLGIDSLALNLEFGLALRRDPAAGAAFGALLAGLYHHAEASKRGFRLREAEAVIEHLRRLPVGLCWHAGRFCGANHAAIDEAGNVYLCCDKFIDSSPHNQARLGNLLDNPLAELFASERCRRLVKELAGLRAACTADCAIGAFCKGGCVHEAVMVAGRGEERGSQGGEERGSQVGCLGRRALVACVEQDFASARTSACLQTA